MKANKQSGGLFIEFAIVISLLLAIVFGAGQQLMTQLREFDHYALATELVMGPQERSLAYDPATKTIVGLSATTTPTIQEFMDTIGNFFKTRAPDDTYAVYMVMPHYEVNQDSGQITNFIVANSFSVFPYGVVPTNNCMMNTTQLTSWSRRYGNGKMYHAADFVAGKAPTTDDDDTGRFGSKIFDIDKSGTRVRRYEPVFPILFMLICSEVKVLGLDQQILTYHTLVPRRHLN